MKLLGVFTVSLLASVVRGAVIKQETLGAREYARRALGVQESSVCEQFFGADYPYICNNNAMCLYCPGKTVGDGTCQVCNGNNECSTGEDEEGCTVHTEPYLNSLCSNSNPDFPFSCATVGSSGVTKCLQESQICDGLWHCEDGSDENSCDYSKQYGTANGQCPVPSQSKLGENAASFDSQMLAAHNYFRCLHGSPSMTTSATMITQATTAVENSAATSGLQHTFTGENLALMSMPIADATGFGLTKMWYDEIVDYNFKNYTLSTGTVGHFTQVVWADSVNLGCAHKVDVDSKTQIACEYDPPGNLASVPAHLENVKDSI